MSDQPEWIKHIYQEVDGFYYYDPPAMGGSYSAHTLRQIAEKLEEMNKAWMDQISRELPQYGRAYDAPRADDFNNP